jgi:hypothetical protein
MEGKHSDLFVSVDGDAAEHAVPDLELPPPEIYVRGAERSRKYSLEPEDSSGCVKLREKNVQRHLHSMRKAMGEELAKEEGTRKCDSCTFVFSRFEWSFLFEEE